MSDARDSERQTASDDDRTASSRCQTIVGAEPAHACGACGQRFYHVQNLLDHDCEEDFGGPDPDDGHAPLAGGGA